MNKIIWEKRFDKYYQTIEMSKSLANLYVWLTDACTSGNSWIETLKKEASQDLFGDMSYIKKSGEMAYIGDSLIGEYPDPKEFEIPIVELIRLLEEFIALKKAKSPYIILSEENGKYVLEGKDTLE